MTQKLNPRAKGIRKRKGFFWKQKIDVTVDMATWTHLDTPAPPPRCPRVRQVSQYRALSAVIIVSLLQTCIKVSFQQEDPTGRNLENIWAQRSLLRQRKCCLSGIISVTLRAIPAPKETSSLIKSQRLKLYYHSYAFPIKRMKLLCQF